MFVPLNELAMKALNKGGWAGGSDIPQTQPRCRGDVMMPWSLPPPAIVGDINDWAAQPST